MYKNLYFLLLAIALGDCNKCDRLIPKKPASDTNFDAKRNADIYDEPEYRAGIILQGKDAKEGEVPFMMALFRNNKFVCGATLISSTYALSARHCVNKTATLSVGYGSLDRNGVTLKTDIKNVYVRKDIKLDMAIIEFKTPIKFSKNIHPAKLPNENDDLPAGKMVTIAGWGEIKYDGPISSNLQKTELPVVDFNKCQKAMKQYPAGEDVTSNAMCAGYDQGGPDSCYGDSGGPLFVNHILFGTVVSGYGCGLPNVYGVYAKITATAVRTWIKTVTGL